MSLSRPRTFLVKAGSLLLPLLFLGVVTQQQLVAAPSEDLRYYQLYSGETWQENTNHPNYTRIKRVYGIRGHSLANQLGSQSHYSNEDYEDFALEFLRANAAELEISVDELEDPTIVPGKRTTVVIFKQKLGELPVFGGLVKVLFSAYEPPIEKPEDPEEIAKLIVERLALQPGEQKALPLVKSSGGNLFSGQRSTELVGSGQANAGTLTQVAIQMLDNPRPEETVDSSEWLSEREIISRWQGAQLDVLETYYTSRRVPKTVGVVMEIESIEIMDKGILVETTYNADKVANTNILHDGRAIIEKDAAQTTPKVVDKAVVEGHFVDNGRHADFAYSRTLDDGKRVYRETKRIVYFDAENGDILGVKNPLIAAVGIGDVQDPDGDHTHFGKPIFVDGTGFLQNNFVKTIVEPPFERAFEADLDFTGYLTAGSPLDKLHALEVNVLGWLTDQGHAFELLSLDDLFSGPLDHPPGLPGAALAEAINLSAFGNFYDSITGKVIFDAGPSFEGSRDASVGYHEWQHWANHVRGGGIYPFTGGPANELIDECFADLNSALMLKFPEIAPYYAKNFGFQFIRNVDNTLTFPDDIVGEKHEDSRICSSAGWEWSKMRGDLAYLIMQESVASFTSLDGLPDVPTILQATDQLMFGGLHSQDIQQAFASRGVGSFTNPPGFVESADDGSNLESPRPYPDLVDKFRQKKTVVGAAAAGGMMLTFDNLTRFFFDDTGNQDTLTIIKLDTTGTIETVVNTYKNTELQGVTVTIPLDAATDSDTVILELNSLADGKRGPGYLVTKAMIKPPDDPPPSTPQNGFVLRASAVPFKDPMWLFVDASMSELLNPTLDIVSVNIDWGDGTQGMLQPNSPHTVKLYNRALIGDVSQPITAQDQPINVSATVLYDNGLEETTQGTFTIDPNLP